MHILIPHKFLYMLEKKIFQKSFNLVFLLKFENKFFKSVPYYPQ